MKRQRAEISSNVISHIKSAYPIKCCRSDKLGIKEKISRGKFPRLIFSCPVPTGLPHRSHCVPMNIIRCGSEVFMVRGTGLELTRHYIRPCCLVSKSTVNKSSVELVRVRQR